MIDILTPCEQDDCDRNIDRCTCSPTILVTISYDRSVWLYSAGKLVEPHSTMTLLFLNQILILQLLLALGLQRETAGRGTMALYLQVSRFSNVPKTWPVVKASAS